MAVQRAMDMEPPKSNYYRCDRVTTVNGRYFFTTREGTLEGPYFTRLEAEREIPRYIERMVQFQAILSSRKKDDA